MFISLNCFSIFFLNVCAYSLKLFFRKRLIYPAIPCLLVTPATYFLCKTISQNVEVSCIFHVVWLPQRINQTSWFACLRIGNVNMFGNYVLTAICINCTTFTNEDKCKIFYSLFLATLLNHQLPVLLSNNIKPFNTHHFATILRKRTEIFSITRCIMLIRTQDM